MKSCLFLAGVLDSIFDDVVLGWERFEFCTDSRSSLSGVGVDYSVFVIPVTLEVDGTSLETVKRLLGAMDIARDWGMKVVLQSSTPCAGGSPWQRKQSESPRLAQSLASSVYCSPEILEIVVEIELSPPSGSVCN